MRCWHLLCMDASTIAKTDHQTCACSQVHVMLTVNVLLNTCGSACCMERNHGASSGTCLKEPDYVADRFHHFWQPDEVDEQTGVFRMFHARTAAQAQIKKNSDTIKRCIYQSAERYCPPEQKEAMGLSERKAKNCGRNFPKGRAAAVLLVFCMKIIRRTAILLISVI